MAIPRKAQASIGEADGADDVAPDPEEEPYEPERVRDLLVLGVSYLLCFDIVALFWKGLYPKLGFQPEPENIEEDDWTPTATTIPFGPYLAAGALVCMLFQAQIIGAWDAYFGQFGPR